MKTLLPSIEQKIREKAIFYIRKGRPTDEEHTLRAVAYGKILLAKEGGNPLVVIPALYLHDVGWSRVDFADFVSSPTKQKKDAESLLLHMQYGAQMGLDILRCLNYDQVLTNKIVSIIALHDAPKKILSMEDLDATIVFEADFLDKFGAEGDVRVLQMFGAQQQRDVKEHLDYYKSILLRTRAAKELLTEIEQKKDRETSG